MRKEKPNKNRPQLWIGIHKYEKENYFFRIRIIYPNGDVEWDTANTWSCFKNNPCWKYNNYWPFNLRKFTSVKKIIKAMKEYDKDTGRRTEFVCNL